MVPPDGFEYARRIVLLGVSVGAFHFALRLILLAIS